jgi:hypothetical protein
MDHDLKNFLAVHEINKHENFLFSFNWMGEENGNNKNNPHGDNHDNVQCNQLITATPHYYSTQ